MIRKSSSDTITLHNKKVNYRLFPSKTGRKLRVRVGPNGVDVIQPIDRTKEEVNTFLFTQEQWILSQIKRIASVKSIRRPVPANVSQIMYRGKPTDVRVKFIEGRKEQNKVIFENGTLVIHTGSGSRTPPIQTLENWLRKQARTAIIKQLELTTRRLKRSPGKVYIMSQRTKWGNCSGLGNLSYNWRLIMAPDEVLRYLVIHEAVHLAMPDHSRKFWLMVQSLCPEMTRAKQWLSANSDQMLLTLQKTLADLRE